MHFVAKSGNFSVFLMYRSTECASASVFAAVVLWSQLDGVFISEES
jgi:hypothetical protein